MSLPRRTAAAMNGRLRWLGLGVILCGLTTISACTVSPLYGEAPAVAGVQADVAAVLSSIAIEPADTRHEQEVRNHLIFLFRGGAGEPVAPAYSLALDVASRTQSAALQQVADEDEPTAGIVTLTADYQLTRTATGELAVSGRRQVTAAFDRPRQQYAAARAERDAENRAARELAELIRLGVAQDLLR
jgi:LPS-assembly lipoprotein